MSPINRQRGAGTVGNVMVTNSGGSPVAWINGEAGFGTTLGNIAENFASSESAIETGSVMILEAQNPGSLKRSEGAYDRRVAGRCWRCFRR